MVVFYLKCTLNYAKTIKFSSLHIIIYKFKYCKNTHSITIFLS